MNYSSLKEICDLSNKENIPFWKVILEDDAKERGVLPSESFNQMKKMLYELIKSDENYDKNKRSKSGISGGDGDKFEKYVRKQKNLSGQFCGKVSERAIKIGETNACMGRIVATPTAGSSGVLPACLLTYREFFKTSDKNLTEALFVAAGIGEIIALNASISGAAGGCQAEIGSASSMAAGALVYLQGGNNEQICSAVAISMKALLGLTCDPVGGLVECPCIKRNSLGALNAVNSCDMAMAGIRSVIPADEVIEAMGEIGKNMSDKYRETGKGGLATTESGKKICKKLEEK